MRITSQRAHFTRRPNTVLLSCALVSGDGQFDQRIMQFSQLKSIDLNLLLLYKHYDCYACMISLSIPQTLFLSKIAKFYIRICRHGQRCA